MSGKSTGRAADSAGMVIRRQGHAITRDLGLDRSAASDGADMRTIRDGTERPHYPARDGARVRGFAVVRCFGPMDVAVVQDIPDSGIGLGHLYAGEKVTMWLKQFRQLLAQGHETCINALMGGELRWQDGPAWNLVVDLGLSEYLQVAIGGISAAAAWHAAPTNATPVPAAGDTMAVHAGWVENQDYTEAARQVWTPGAEASQSIDNSAAPSTYSVNASATLGGTFMTDSVTKGGTAGTLFSAVAFTGGNRSVVNLDSVEITYTHTMADDGV